MDVLPTYEQGRCKSTFTPTRKKLVHIAKHTSKKSPQPSSYSVHRSSMSACKICGQFKPKAEYTSGHQTRIQKGRQNVVCTACLKDKHRKAKVKRKQKKVEKKRKANQGKTNEDPVDLVSASGDGEIIVISDDDNSGKTTVDEKDLLLERSFANKKSGGAPIRFFDEVDITTRCYRCGGVGHISVECVNAPLERACFRCGGSGHEASKCSNEICYNCFETGHKSLDCRLQRQKRLTSSDFLLTSETLPKGDLDLTRCMDCGKFGHINCKSCLQFGKIDMFCFMCGKTGHVGKECGVRYREGGRHRVRQPSSNPQECFKCGKLGHISRDCPSKNFRRGNQRTHYNDEVGGRSSYSRSRSPISSSSFFNGRGGKRSFLAKGRGGHSGYRGGK